MIRLIASDMDGTLLDSRKRMPEGLFDAVRKLKAQGRTFVVASGRQYFSLRQDFKEIAGEIVFIAENGALIVENDRQLFLDPIDRDTVLHILRETRSLDEVYPVVCCAGGALVEAGSPQSFIGGVKQYYEDTQVVPDLIAACEKLEDVCKVAFFDETQAKTRALPALERLLSDRLQVIYSSEQWVDVMKPGVNKGRAMQMLQKMKGVTRAECMAFGDYLNDYELLESVEESYAMKNALDEVKRIARYIAPGNDENGVLRVLEERFSL